MEVVRQFNDIYRDKKVLITGHTGFKGSWLALWLTELGAEVIGFSKDTPTTPNHIDLLNLKITHVTGDILDRAALKKTFQQYQPEIVFHLAAQSLVRLSYQQPVATFEANIMGTVHVLEACRQTDSVQAIVNVTSDKCYQNNEWERGYTEEDAMGGFDPYSASKGAAEIVANAYRNSFFNPDQYGKSHHILLADVRAGNVIGGGDWAADRLIPDVARATSAGQTVIVRSPASVRPWQHVLEPLSGYLQLGWKLLEGKKEFADNWNFGPVDGSSLTVKEVLDYAKKYWPEVQVDIQENTATVHEAHLLTLNSNKARTQLGWKNVWGAEETFNKTISWYKDFYATQKIDTVADLQAFITDAKKLSVDWLST